MIYYTYERMLSTRQASYTKRKDLNAPPTAHFLIKNALLKEEEVRLQCSARPSKCLATSHLISWETGAYKRENSPGL